MSRWTCCQAVGARMRRKRAGRMRHTTGSITTTTTNADGGRGSEGLIPHRVRLR